jgi:NAD(P)-dependent dehydrogenase (short-subunit alcohol dehydrogenase family)
MEPGAGATLALLDLEEAPVRATLAAAGTEGAAVTADVTDERAAAAAAASVERDVGPIDVVVNTAGAAFACGTSTARVPVLAGRRASGP